MALTNQFGIWSNELESEPVRLVAFERWLRIQLGIRLAWPRDESRARRQIGQASKFVEIAVADLGKRGWLFRPAELAQLLTDELDHIATYQREGGVRDLYKYLEGAWKNWAGRQAEELAQAAKEQGVHRAHMAQPLPPSLAEIVQRKLEALEARDREIKAGRALLSGAQRARKPRCNPHADPLLPGF